MKKILLATLVAAAALSLGACQKPVVEENATTAEASFNEAEIPAEGNAGGIDDFANSSAGLADPTVGNAAAPLGNATEPTGNTL
ncbi:hypothetical protein Q5H91_15315 [Sphingomonas sp. KR1UV-12]|uniref:Circumsporozoite protein n=1 Tax=Sphingomonas aurea TaxID=3063994 RepID=A0ABT9ENQ6_9SPHN|nr:hypothetical protein [Sphingomonas sp. KR1UV-12]MDP1028592.1 hypothetical protein [Sphingomonas sp. KR1UV-12]